MFDEFGELGFGQAHHVGVIVPDLEEAIADMTDVGEWIRLAVRQPPLPAGDVGFYRLIRETINVPLTAAFSRPGPVHFEMIQGVPGTIWAAREEAFLHHVAYWVPEERLQEYSLALEERGMRLEATRLNMAGTDVRAVYHRWRTGLRIELFAWGLPGTVTQNKER